MLLDNIQVLVVDDSRIMRRVVTQKLAKLGLQYIVEAANGRAGLEIVEEGDIALIISDWSMPGMTGMEFLRAIRQDEQMAHIPFVLVTAEAQLYNILMAYRQQVDEYITKPFTNEYFEYAVGKVLQKYYGIGMEVRK